MRKYKVNDLFVSLKGEGVWTGTPMSFIRLAGCNVKCDFCDTAYETYELKTTDEIVDWVSDQGFKRVVLTGGEPLMQKVNELVEVLNHNGFMVHLETNGSLAMPIPFNVNGGNWICASPKTLLKVNKVTLREADEVKFLCGIPNWKEIIDKYSPLCEGKKWIMPITLDGVNRKISTKIKHEAMEYCFDHPEFTFATQIHKYLRIK